MIERQNSIYDIVTLTHDTRQNIEDNKLDLMPYEPVIAVDTNELFWKDEQGNLTGYNNMKYLENKIFETPNFAQDKNLTTCRIPAIQVINSGRIVVVCDMRAGLEDVANFVKIGMKYSDDKGNSWSETRAIMNLGDLKTQGISDPCLVYNKYTNRLICLAYNLEQGYIWDKNSINGWDVFMTYSDDNGETWSQLVSLKNYTPSGWKLFFVGPGGSVNSTFLDENGTSTIVVPIQRWWSDSGEKSKSGVMYSKDNGLTWTVTNSVPDVTSECAVTYHKNKLFLRAKSESDMYGRFIYTSTDLGLTWTTLNTDEYATQTQGSMINIKNSENEFLLKCENEGYQQNKPRKNLTIKISEDGESWKGVFKVRQEDGWGYSAMCNDDTYLYVVHELDTTNAGITFKRIPISQFDGVYCSKERKLITNPVIGSGVIKVEHNTSIVEHRNSAWTINKIVGALPGNRITFRVYGSGGKLTFNATSDSSGTGIILNPYGISGGAITLLDGDYLTLECIANGDFTITDFNSRSLVELDANNTMVLNFSDFTKRRYRVKNTSIITNIDSFVNNESIYLYNLNGTTTFDLGENAWVNGKLNNKVVLTVGGYAIVSCFNYGDRPKIEVFGIDDGDKVLWSGAISTNNTLTLTDEWNKYKYIEFELRNGTSSIPTNITTKRFTTKYLLFNDNDIDVDKINSYTLALDGDSTSMFRALYFRGNDKKTIRVGGVQGTITLSRIFGVN